MKKLSRDLAKSLAILFGLLLGTMLVLWITGQFRVDDTLYPSYLGIYNSAFKGLPGYFNPLWQTLVSGEVIGIVLLIVGLVALYKWLRLPILPWLFFIILAELGFKLMYQVLIGARAIDSSLQSDFLWFVYVELTAIVAMIISQLFYYFLQRQKLWHYGW